MKVYCKNCKYLEWEDDYVIYLDITVLIPKCKLKFKEMLLLKDGNDLSKENLIKTTTELKTIWSKHFCGKYKRKWWMFWVKEEK